MTDSIEGEWVNRGSSLVIGRVGKPLKDYPNIFEIYKTLVSKRAIFAVINVDNDNLIWITPDSTLKYVSDDLPLTIVN